MSVYIKGMEMPKGCATCQYCDRAWNKPKCKAKSIQGRFMEQRLDLDRTRQKWCPLIPVPEHGRLIDADALTVKLQRHREYHSDGSKSGAAISNGIGQCLDIINGKECPTIIPADKGETE